MFGDANGTYETKKGLEPNMPVRATDVACTMKFDNAAGEDPMHRNMGTEEDSWLVQRCDLNGIKLRKKKTWTVDLGASDTECNPWKRTTCPDLTKDCMHQHQESDVKTYVRCTYFRPFAAANV